MVWVVTEGSAPWTLGRSTKSAVRPHTPGYTIRLLPSFVRVSIWRTHVAWANSGSQMPEGVWGKGSDGVERVQILTGDYTAPRERCHAGHKKSQ